MIGGWSDGTGVAPARCHTVLPGLPAGRNVAVCVRGERGLRMTSLDFGGSDEAASVVRAVNASLGVDIDQERELVAGCLFGWPGILVAGPAAAQVSAVTLH